AGGKFEGFRFGDGVPSVDDALLLIEPEAARQYAAAQEQTVTVGPPEGEETDGADTGRGVTPRGDGGKPRKDGEKPPPRAKSFQGTADVPAATAKMRLVQIAEEVVSLLASDPNATIRVTVEVAADFPAGVSDALKRAVSENATSLGFKTKDWE